MSLDQLVKTRLMEASKGKKLKNQTLPGDKCLPPGQGSLQLKELDRRITFILIFGFISRSILLDGETWTSLQAAAHQKEKLTAADISVTSSRPLPAFISFLNRQHQ